MKPTTMKSHTRAEGASIEACAGTEGLIGGGGLAAAVVSALAVTQTNDTQSAIIFTTAALGSGYVGVKALKDSWQRYGCENVAGALVGSAVVSGVAAYVYFNAPSFLR